MPTSFKPTSKLGRFFAIFFSVILIAFLASAGIFYAQGGKTSIIQTPSMATYSPVGTLVLTLPVKFSDIKQGDTILFNPPASKETFFHRVHEVNGNAIKTKGDLNGTVDPWTVHSDNVLGKELLHIKFLGFLLRVLPLLFAGGIALVLITHYYAVSYFRFPSRVLGFSFLFAVAAYVTKPFFKAQLISQAVVNGKATTTLVPTGIFDIRGTAEHGSSVHATPGQLVTVQSTYHDKLGHYNVLLAPDLTTLNWIIIVSFIITPTMLCIAYALWAKHKDYDTVDIIEPDELIAEATPTS